MANRTPDPGDESERLTRKRRIDPLLDAAGWPRNNLARAIMASNELHADLYGWWRITETSQWVNDGLDDLGPAMISITGHADRLRMHCLLAYVNLRPTKTGASFTWEGAWEYDEMSGSGRVRLAKDGMLRGRIKIKDGDESTFVAKRTSEPAEPIPFPPSYRDKWKPRRRR